MEQSFFFGGGGGGGGGRYPKEILKYRVSEAISCVFSESFS